MKLNSKAQFSARSGTLLVSVLMAIALTACGGGNGSAGAPISGSGSGSGSSGSGSGGTTAGAKVAMVLKSASTGSGCTDNIVTTSCQVIAVATVTDATGKPVPNTIVTFANSLSLTNLSPTSGTAATDANGVAQATVSAAGLPTTAQSGSAGTINASATVGTVTVTAKQTYTLGNVTVNLVTLLPANNSATSPAAVNAYGSTQISVQVNANGTPYTTQPVGINFTSSCVQNGSATLTPTATTINGIAVVTYTDNGCGSKDVIVASVGSQTASIYLNVTPPGVGSINFFSANPTTSSIVFSGTGGTSRTSTALITFQVVDTQGKPLQNTPVTFTDNDPTQALAVLNTTTNTTGTDGTVTTSVTAVPASGNPVPGTLTVTATATVNKVTVTAISNKIIVGTGTPAPKSFSIAAKEWNLEGFNYFGTQDIISVFIADSNGNPVVDGTQVVGTTDEGSIGSSNSSNAGCTTTNGQCQLIFTSQLPNCSPVTIVNGQPSTASCTSWGIATLTFTASDGTNTPITDTEYLYQSGSYPRIFYNDPVSAMTYESSGSTLNGTCTGTDTTIGILLTDQVGNPMPIGTTIAVKTTATGVSFGTIFPATLTSTSYSKTGGFLKSAVTNSLWNGPANAVINGTALSIPVTACGAGTSFPMTVTTTTPLGYVNQIQLTYSF